MGVLTQDLQYALRSFRRAPGFTFVALLTLALGIGGTTAIFSLVDGVVLRPLPYPRPHHILRLVHVNERGDDASFAAADYLDLKRDTAAFASVAGYREDIIDLTGRGEPLRVAGLQTTGAFFDVLLAPPLAGRVYHEATDPPGTPVAVIGERLWRQQFGGDPAVVGTKVRLNGSPTEIIGVVAETVRHPIRADVWMLSPLPVPVSPIPDEDGLASRDVEYFMAFARLSGAASLGDAREQLKATSARLAREFPETNGDEIFDAQPLAAALVSDVRGALIVLLGAVGFVLLIACANVAGLLLARGASRRRELAVRTALGAGRGQLVRQLMTESLVLAVAGGTLGLLVAMWTLNGLIALAPDNIPRLAEVSLDWRVALFSLVATLVVGVLFGLTPAMQASRPTLQTDLKDGGRSGTSRTGARSAMVVAQVALALVLLIGAGLMLTSLFRLQTVDPGFRTTELVAVELLLPQSRYDETRQRQFYTTILERLRGNPVTAQSALLFPFPLGGSNARSRIRVEGQPERPRAEQTTAELNMVSPGYFATAGLRLIEGRDFTEADGAESTPVAIVNEAALTEFGGRSAIGQRVNLGTWINVVGVVSGARRQSLDIPPQPAVFLPYTQFVMPYMGVMVKTDRGAGATASVVRAAVAEVDPELPIGDVRTIEQMLSSSTGQPRFRSFLIASFAGLALLLAAVGIYGLISFTVAQRVPEIGVRLALGANPRQVFGLVLGHGLKLAGAGVIIGLAAAAAATTLVRGLLFNTSTTDPLVYAALSALLLTIAALACYVPARRAMRVDPMTALRNE